MWGILALLIGVGYGWYKPGRQDKLAILKTGFLAGLVLAVLFALVGTFAGSNPLGFAPADPVGLLLAVVVVTLLFVVGVSIGDWIEARAEARTERPERPA
jgi:hypothetical protein